MINFLRGTLTEASKYSRQPLKNFKEYGLLRGCLPQILLAPFLNTLSLKHEKLLLTIIKNIEVLKT